MATPHVAGTAALYLGENPSATPSQVAAAIETQRDPGKISGNPLGTPNLLDYTGFVTAPAATRRRHRR